MLDFDALTQIPIQGAARFLLWCAVWIVPMVNALLISVWDLKPVAAVLFTLFTSVLAISALVVSLGLAGYRIVKYRP